MTTLAHKQDGTLPLIDCELIVGVYKRRTDGDRHSRNSSMPKPLSFKNTIGRKTSRKTNEDGTWARMSALGGMQMRKIKQLARGTVT